MTTREARRVDPDPYVREQAARADGVAGRDMAWARTDPHPYVREQAARADGVAGRDMTWARVDPDQV